MRRKYTTLPYTEYPVLAFDDESHRLPIDTIILHSTNSTYQSAISWFNNPNAGTSAHYIISNNGDLAAMLEEYFVAFHSGNYQVNQRSIGIEHEGYVGMVRTDKEYAESAKLVADICKFYAIPCDNVHIKPHSAIVATACPTDLDVTRIIREANAILTPSPQPPVNNDGKKAVEMGGALDYLGAVGYIVDHDSNNYLDGKFVALIKKLYGDYKDTQKQLAETTSNLLITQANLDTCLHQPAPVPPPAPDCSAYTNAIDQAKAILYGKGWWWDRIYKLRAIFPKL